MYLYIKYIVLFIFVAVVNNNCPSLIFSQTCLKVAKIQYNFICPSVFSTVRRVRNMNTSAAIQDKRGSIVVYLLYQNLIGFILLHQLLQT